MRIMKVTAITALLCVGLLATTVFPVIAQDAPGPGKSGERVKGYDDWRFSVNLAGWTTAMHGDVTAAGNTVPVDLAFHDLVSLLFNGKVDFTMDGRFEVNKGPWGFFSDVFYARMSESVTGQQVIDIPIFVPPAFPIQFPPASTIQRKADVTGVASVGEAGMSYDVYASPCLVANMPELIVEGLAGARNTYIRTKVHLEVEEPLRTRTFDADKSKDWVDPFVGGRVLWRPGEKWVTSLRADFGGFTVNSDFMFNIDAEAVYRINRCFFVNGGFRALYTDYKTGSDNTKFAYNMWMYGPYFGVGVEF